MGYFRKHYKHMTRFFRPPQHTVLAKKGTLHVTDTSSFENATAKVPAGCCLVGYYRRGSEIVMPIIDDPETFKQFERMYFSEKTMLRVFYIVETKVLDEHVEYEF